MFSILNTTVNVHSSAAENSHVVSGKPCRLVSAKVTNTGDTDLWLQVFDAKELPEEGTACDRTPVFVPAGLPNGDTWDGGTALAKGCVVALSEDRDTLTLPASDVGRFDVEVSQ